MTQRHKTVRSDEYATRSDFCRLYLEQVNSLYLLSLLLTADPQKAEKCFVLGFDDSINNSSVFKERANLWARRCIILHAIRLLCPRPIDETEVNEARLPQLVGDVPAQVRAYPNFAPIVKLDPLKRFVFIMSVLEKYSDQECSLLLGCFRRDVINARIAAIRDLASFAVAPEIQPERKVIAFAGVNHANRQCRE